MSKDKIMTSGSCHLGQIIAATPKPNVTNHMNDIANIGFADCNATR
jgi:hypothetical protein